MKKWFLAIMCVFVMVIASTPVSAGLGPASVEISDDGADATCPDIQNGHYSRSIVGDDYYDIVVDCVVNDVTTGSVDFSFMFILKIELWLIMEQIKLSDYDEDDWGESNEDSANYPNPPLPPTSSTISVEIQWRGEPNFMYRCFLTVYIINHDEEVDDLESGYWDITMGP